MSNQVWFRIKHSGWGWVPVTWQGWLIIIAYAAIILANFWRIDSLSHSASDTLINFVPQTFAVSAVLIWICFKKGEHPRWR